MITSFFNPFLIKALQSIIFGGASQELEQVLAEGIGLIGGPKISRASRCPDQVRVVKIAMNSQRLPLGPLPVCLLLCVSIVLASQLEGLCFVSFNMIDWKF
jgi:hypothetical protein